MWYRLKLLLNNPAKSLWIHPTLGAIFAILFSLLAKAGMYVIPVDAVPTIDRAILDDLLNIIASTMLAVTTFSLSIMVSALASGSNSATPRARMLIMADDTARVAIASFISAFIYSVIAKIALSLQYYGEVGRFILFISTILVLMYIIFTLIRWVHTLSQLGSLGDAIEKIEKVAHSSLASWRFQPNLGAIHDLPNMNTQPSLIIEAKQTGYLHDINLGLLQEIGLSHNLHIHIVERTGKFLSPGTLLLEVFCEADLSPEQRKELEQQLRIAMMISMQRSYAQDPRFGLLVMSEVGQRAMSASINDPATAITVLNGITRLLVDTQPNDTLVEQKFTCLSISDIDLTDVINSIFAPIARDSVSNLEVNQRLLKSLAIIYQHAPEQKLRQAAYQEAEDLKIRALEYFSFAKDREKLEDTFKKAFGL